MTFISYAQNYEDVILWRALRDIERGLYVDVGAADPQVDSVTMAFYERGWSGINIEPLDEYFDKLTQARPRDTTLKVAVGREAGVRELHAFPGTGLSTLDSKIGARHHAAGYVGSERLVPVMTLTKIIEDCAPEAIHFLKIDVEGAEAEVLEGLNLERIRPWIIVIEANEPNSTRSTRAEWEHLVIGRGYGLAYFDGLNCFYVADEVAVLKERLAVPPNFFDDFIRFPEWAIQQEIVGLRGLEVALRAEQTKTANLRNALRIAQKQTSNLRDALQTEQAQSAKLQAQSAKLQARMDHLLGRIHQLEAQLALPSVDRAIGRAWRRVHKAGDRLTGGGLRSLTRRLLSTFATKRHKLKAEDDSAVASSIPSPAGGASSSEDPSAIVAALPASARPIYLRLNDEMSDSEAWNRTQ